MYIRKFKLAVVGWKIRVMRYQMCGECEIKMILFLEKYIIRYEGMIDF